MRPNPTMTDDDSPELTAADFARARPASDVLPELFGQAAAAAMLKPRGRPKAAAPKVSLTMRFDAVVVESFKATGPGWQTRMNAALLDWLKSHPAA